ncbi:hypothetical protein Y1Q_0008163 [Alligator mississippiensis]|uniref:Uncharacterized protein n=1 Tax=Alligator mississippiensis TaxID=8496 RepID=A0A151N179_ALLMI|nr:hypothetical protein Y1Q_0008163 [Alligator mississippiensis]
MATYVAEELLKWRSPVIPVAKPNGLLFLCINFQKLNTLATFDTFPMPHITHLIEKIGEARLMHLAVP